MEDLDMYGILEVSPTATEREIKAAFRKMARKYHPDVNKEEGAAERFQRIAKAYRVLSDSAKRKRYDNFGKAAVDGMDGGSGSGSGPDIEDMNLDDVLDDVFGSFFGASKAGPGGPGSRRRAKPKQVAPERGADLEVEVHVPFEVGVFGADWTVKVKREERCTKCEGRGIKLNLKRTSCTTCGGSGVVSQVTSTPLGVMQTQQNCNRCGGSGTDPDCVCRGCRSKGTKQRNMEVSVAIPGGIESGSQLRVRHQGDKGLRNGAAGDLYVTCRVERSDDFKRDGADIRTEREISMFDAMLGTTLQVRTVDGGVEDLEVPPGTQPDQEICLLAKGAPKLGMGGVRGNHYVSLKVEIPRLKNKKHRKLAEQLRDAVMPAPCVDA